MQDDGLLIKKNQMIKGLVILQIRHTHTLFKSFLHFFFLQKLIFILLLLYFYWIKLIKVIRSIYLQCYKWFLFQIIAVLFWPQLSNGTLYLCFSHTRPDSYWLLDHLEDLCILPHSPNGNILTDDPLRCVLFTVHLQWLYIMDCLCKL